MVYCVAYGCTSKSFKGCGLHFFLFPTNPKIRKQWVVYCKREDFLKAGPHSVLCSKHFSRDCYERDPLKMAALGYANAKPQLKKDCVPDIPIVTSPGQIQSSSKPQMDKRRKMERGAYEKRKRAELLSGLLHDADPEDTAPETTGPDEDVHEVEAHGDNEGNEISQNIDTKQIVKTRDACFQIKSKPKTSTRRHQIAPKRRDFSVQTRPLTKTIGTQYCVQDVDDEYEASKLTQDEEEDEFEEEMDQTDDDWVPDEEEVLSDEDCGDGGDDVNELLIAGEPNKERQFLIAESCLLELLNKCKECGQCACVTLKCFVGTMIIVEVQCAQGHDYTWRSQACSNSMPWGNLLLSAAILYSGSSPAKVLTMFGHLNVPVFNTRTFSDLQYSYLVPTVLRTWDLCHADHITELQGQSLCLGGDGRCDSPGHTAKFGSYTLMNIKDNKIVHIELVQSNEVKNSNQMELEGLKRGLEYLEDCNVTVEELVTDRHVQVKKYMKEEHIDKHHYFDVWHVAKGVSKKLEQAAKKKECQPIRPWIKSVVNHMYWLAASSGNDSELKKAKWLSILNHISDRHDGHGDLFPRCQHGPLLESKQWIKSGSRAYKAFRDVVESQYLLRDLGKLSPVHQTYGIEVFHNIVNHFAPKSTHFFYESMLARIHLAALHFNENSGNKQATTRSGQLRYQVSYPKAKKGEEAVVKPVKQSPTYNYVEELMEMTVSRRKSYSTYKDAKCDAERIIGDVPGTVSCSYKKHNKQDLIARHKSRYIKS